MPLSFLQHFLPVADMHQTVPVNNPLSTTLVLAENILKDNFLQKMWRDPAMKLLEYVLYPCYVLPQTYIYYPDIQYDESVIP